MSRSVKKGPFVEERLMNITEDMVGCKLGEFSPTRTFRGHAGDKTTGKK